MGYHCCHGIFYQLQESITVVYKGSARIYNSGYQCVLWAWTQKACRSPDIGGDDFNG
jgi:hypothetical protein